MVNSPWTDHAVKCYTQFRDLVAPSGLPPAALQQIWDQAIATGSEAIVDGLFRIKRCSLEGRMSMGFDLQHIERSVSWHESSIS